MVRFKRNQHDMILEILKDVNAGPLQDTAYVDWAGYYVLPASGVKLYFKYDRGHYIYKFK